MLQNIKHFAQCNDTDYIDKVQDMHVDNDREENS